MALENKRADQTTERDLDALIENGVSEGTTIDYKESLYGPLDDDKREFLFDVTSFANAAGGHLVIGMKEEEGLPTDLCGLENLNADEVKLRFENMLRDNIKPRLPGVTMSAVSLQNNRSAFVLHIPKSFAAPHMVEFRKHTWFYSRNSAGKYRLDVDQLRAAFVQAEELSEQFRQYRLSRLGRIIADQAPISLGGIPKLVVHVVPFNAFDPSVLYDPVELARDQGRLIPIHGYSSGSRYNFDGYLNFATRGTTPEYVQMFRNGCIEAVDTDILEEVDARHIPIEYLENQLFGAVPKYLAHLESVGVVPPLALMVSLLGVAGRTMPPLRRGSLRWRETYPVDRDELIIPEVIIDSFTDDLTKIMKPVLDAIWNAVGFPRSMSYDDEGNWSR